MAERGRPSGRLKQVAHNSGKAGRRLDITRQRDPFMKRRADRVAGFQRVANAKNRCLYLRRIRAKQTVPDDERARIILVTIMKVRCMVHPVVGRRVEYMLEEPKLAHMPRMKPVLIKVIEREKRDHHQRADAEQKSRDHEHRLKPRFHKGRTQSRADIILLTGMMVHMRGPAKPYLVNGPMIPIEEKVDDQIGRKDEGDTARPIQIKDRKLVNPIKRGENRRR